MTDTARNRSPRTRQRWLLAGKSTLGVVLLATLLIWNDNGRKLLDVVSGFRLEYIAALLACAMALVWVSCLKWSLFLRDRGAHTPMSRLFGLYLIGFFFNNFMPGSLGGDVARAYLLGREISSQAASFASVFMERATGIVGLSVLAALFALWNHEILANPIIALVIAGALLACGVAVLVFYRPSLIRPLLARARRLPLVGKIAAMLEQLLDEVTYFRSRHRLLALSMLYSFAFHLLAGLNCYVATLAIGLRPDPLDILVITPVIMLLTMIPISPSNIGWWEWCFSILLQEAGATAAEGLAVALTTRASAMSVSLVGGVLFLRWRTERVGAARLGPDRPGPS